MDPSAYVNEKHFSLTGFNMDYGIFERAVQKRKESLEQSIRSAETEYRELMAEVRVYNHDVYSCMEKEFRTVKALSNELLSCHVTREKKKRTKKKLLVVEKRGHTVASKRGASKGGSSSKPASKLSTKQKDVHHSKAKHKTGSTSQALPGTHLTPLSPTAKCSVEEGIDAILAASKPAQKESAKTSNTTVSGPSSTATMTSPLTPPPVHKLPSASGNNKVTSAPVHRTHNASVTSKVTSPTSKGKPDSFGKASPLSFVKGLKHDVQLFTVLDTTVSPPLPRYIAKIVPESTALIPLSSSARNPLRVGSTLTASASTHSTVSPTHSTSNPAPSASSPGHPKSTLTTAIPKLSSSSAQNKTSSKTAASSKSVHKDTTSNNMTKASVSAPKKKIKPIMPPTVHVCDQLGCRESFSQVELLTLHKLTVHRLLPQLIQYQSPSPRCKGSLIRAGPELVAAAQPLADESKKVEKSNNKRVRIPSDLEEDSGRKFIKLENGKSSSPELASPLHNTAPKPWRNFARKSTGRSCSLKRKRVFKNRLQLKLTKISTKGRKMPQRTVNQVKRPNQGPFSHYRTQHGYRNPEFFRNLIRSQLKLPTTNQKAAATSDYISLQPDTGPPSVTQTNKTFPGPGPAFMEDEEVCARAFPFTGNCARTRKFTPEVFSKPRKLSEQDRINSSSSSSISTSIGGEMQAPSSEDESFPLVVLSPVVSRQQSYKDNDNRLPPKLATTELCAASPQPPPAMDESVGDAVVHDVECEGMVQSPPPEHEKVQQETRLSVAPLPSIAAPVRPRSPVITSPTVLSPGIENSEYTMRLLQTIAKLSGDASVPQPSYDGSVIGEKSRKSSVRSPPPSLPLVIEEGEVSDDLLDDEPCTSLMVSVDLSRLSRVPVPPPCPSETEVGVLSHRLGSFTSRGAQVERGLIIDSDDLERRLTVKVNEALCEMKEKLHKTERRVREVMKEKKELEKILEAKLKMIKDLTTTGIKPVFADKETMTDPLKEFTEITSNKKRSKSKTMSTSTQTLLSGPLTQRRTAAPSRCLSHLSDKELEKYLRVSPPASVSQSEDDDVTDVSNDVIPASSKNKWMFESSDSARSSPFNLQVRFMRALMQSADDQNGSMPSSMVSSSLLSRDLCSTFTKIQRLNRQLQVLPLVSVLKEKVDIVTSNLSHLLSHLPLPKGGEYEGLVLLMKLSVGTSAYNVGWKIKELLALLGDVDADRLPTYFKAELKLVMKHVQNALQFGELGMKNVTIDHTLRPLEQAPIIRLIDDDAYDCGDLDLDDILSSSDDDDVDLRTFDKDVVEVGGSRDVVAKRPKPVTTLVQLGDRCNDKGQKRRRRRSEKTHPTKESRPRHTIPSPPKGKQSQLRGKGGKFAKIDKLVKSKHSKTSKKVPSATVSKASNSPVSSATVEKSSNHATVKNKQFSNHVGSLVDTSTPLSLPKPTAKVDTPTNGGSSVTVTPISHPILPINSNKDLLEPIKLLTSLAATMISKGIPVGNAVTTSTVSISQPRATQSAVSTLASSLEQGKSVGTNTINDECRSGRVEASNLSSTTFTPIAKALSPTSTSPSGLSFRSLTTPSFSLSSKNGQVSAVSAAPRASQVQVMVLPSVPSLSVTSVMSQVQPQTDSVYRRSVTPSSSTLSLSSSTLPPAVIAASSLLSLPPGPWNRLPISLPPSIVTTSAIPALQNSARRQGRTQSMTNAPAPLMRSSIVNSFPAPTTSGTSRLATPSVTSPPSINMTPKFSLPVVAMNMRQLFSMPVAIPPSGTVTVSPSLATPTVAPPTIVSSTPSVVASSPSPASTAPSSSSSATSEDVSTHSAVNISEAPSTDIVTTSTESSLPSDTLASFSEASTSPRLSSTINIAAATPTTCTVTPVEGVDLLPDLPESNNSTTVVVIDPSSSPEAEQPPLPPPPSSTLPTTVSDTVAASLSSLLGLGSSPSPSNSVGNTSSSDPTGPKSNPAAVGLPSSVESAAMSSSSRSSLSKASPTLEEILSSSSALLTSIAAQGVDTPQSATTTVSQVSRGEDGPQRFRNFMMEYAMQHLCVAREQSTSQGIQTLSSVRADDSKHRPKRSSRIQNQAGISSTVAALKASIFKGRKNSPQTKGSAPSSSTKDSSTVQDCHRLVALSPSPLTDTYMNHLTTTLNANPTLEDLKMMYSPQTPTDSTTTVESSVAASSNSSVIVIDDDGTETAALCEEDTAQSAGASPLPTTTSQANPTTSTESQQSSASPSENSISTPPISSPPSDTTANGDVFVFPDGINPRDVTPLVQVMHDEKGVLIKWTLPKKYLELQEGVTMYELYAHIIKGGADHEEIPPVSEWSQVGKVKPLRLPMAVTLTNVVKTKKYFFSVRVLFGSEACASQFSKPSCFGEESKVIVL